MFISFLFSWYSLYPSYKAYKLLKEFIKDIIHDINTPISSIKLNLSMINKSIETKAIYSSIVTLELLYKNLENYLSKIDLKLDKYEIKKIIDTQVNFFTPIWRNLEFKINIKNKIIVTDKYILSRIIYNLIQNSCKYNTTHGFVSITYDGQNLIISNSSYGIKNINKIFNRFYKESDRSLGLGLHIVAKLLKQLNYKYKASIDSNNIFYIEITLC